MPKWFETLQQQREMERNSITAVENAGAIPEDASPDHGWSLWLNVKKITPRLTANGQTYYWLLVKDKACHAFTLVVWDYQWDYYGPFEEGQGLELAVKVPTGDYTAWTLY
jgi:hypothetical protein